MDPTRAAAPRRGPNLISYVGRGKRDRRHFAVVSGESTERVIYARCTVAPDTVACFNISYPTARSREFDPIVTRMSLSLRAMRRDRLAHD